VLESYGKKAEKQNKRKEVQELSQSIVKSLRKEKISLIL
jgi:hypothetical protein